MPVPRHWLRQGSTYVAIGLVQLAVDTVAFIGLTALGVALAPANVTGRLAGACLGFILNGRMTFAMPDQQLRWAAFGRFALLWLVMTILGTALLQAVEQQLGLRGSWYAKPMVETMLAVLGFLAMKFFVFRVHSALEPAADVVGVIKSVDRVDIDRQRRRHDQCDQQ